MSKYIIILYLFMNVGTYALPGMSDITYDFSLNSNLFSESAINCQKNIPSNLGLSSISEFMNKMNCNNITDPIKFCNCVNSISSNRLQESVDNNIVEKVIEQIAIESVAGRIEDIDLYYDLISVVGANKDIKQCFEQRSDDPLFGELLRRAHSGVKVTMKDRLVRMIMNDIFSHKNKVKNTNKYEIFGTANDIKKRGIYHLEQVKNKGEGNYQLESSLGDSFWEGVSTNPIAKLIRNDNYLPLVIDQYSDINIYDKSFTIERPVTDDVVDTHINTYATQNYFLDPDGKRLINSAIESACNDVTREIKSIIEKADISKTIRNLTVAYQSPGSEEQIKASAIIQDKITKELKKENSKSSVQEVNFQRDIVFCKNQEVYNLRASENNNDAKDEKSSQELIRSTEAMVHSKEARDKARSALESVRKKYRDIENNKQRKESEVIFLMSLLNGKYSEVNSGSHVTLDIENSELIDDAEKYSLKINSLLNSHRKYSKTLTISKEFIQKLIKENEAEVAKLKDVESKLGISYDAATALYSNTVSQFKESEVENTRLTLMYGEKVGMHKALSVVVEAEAKEGKKLGVESGLSFFFENEIRKGNPIITKDQDFNFYSNKNQMTEISNINTNLSTISNQVEVNDSTEYKVKQEDSRGELVGESSTKKIPNIFSKPNNSEFISPKGVTNQAEVSESADNENSLRLEERIKELESLVKKKSLEQSDNRNKSVKKLTSSIKKQDSSMDSLATERKKIQNELDNLKTQSLSHNEVFTNSEPSVENSDGITFSQNSRNSVSSKDENIVKDSRGVMAPSAAVSTASNIESTQSQSQSQPQSQVEDDSSQELSSSEPRLSTIDSEITLDALAGSKVGLEPSDIEFEAIGTGLDESQTRVVKVEFLMSEENLLEQERLIKTLFIEDEKELIIETLEGKKIIVKQSLNAINENDKKKLNKKRHKNLIQLLQISQKDEI